MSVTAAFNPLLQERTDEFRRLLCDVSQKLVETEVTQIEYLKYIYTGTKRTGIELLIELEKRGVFCPTSTEPLVKLLEDIKRHDIAKHIRDEYQTKYPDQNDNGPVSIPITRTASLPTPRPPYLVQMKRSATLTGDVPDIRVSLIEAKSQPQLRGSTNSSIKNYHPSSDICCDGPPQSPFSVTSSSTNEDTRYNILSRSLSSSTDYLNSNYGDVIPRPEVDKSERSSSWSEGARIHNVSPSKSSETLPEARNHKPSCIPKKNGYKCTSPSKSSDVSLSPVAERVYIAEINNGDGLVMKALSEEVSDKDPSLSHPHSHIHTYTQGTSKHASKLKRLGSKFGLPGKKSSTKKHQERITKCTWTIEKNSLLQFIWEHRHHEYLKHSDPIPIDIECGELNPYISLRLYPFGLFEDKNRSMTLLLNPIIPDKCPPLPEDANFRLSWGIFTLEADAENLLEQSKKPVKAQFVQGVVYVHKFFPHALLQEHKCEELKICIYLSTCYSCPNTHTVTGTNM